MTETQQAISDAIMVLFQTKNRIAITYDHFLTLCQADPEYAIGVIEDKHHLIPLLQLRTALVNEVESMIVSAEWELQGATRFLEAHSNDTLGQYISVIGSELQDNPQKFSRADLHKILNTASYSAIHELVAQRLGEQLTAFAERLTAEPLGMSQDIESLKRSINNYGFGNELNEALQKIDEELKRPQDAFDQAGTIRHIRSFYEALHESLCKELRAKKLNVGNGTDISQCGQAIDYLQRKRVTTPKIQKLGRCLYGILSDGDYGVHALKANRDYTRLCRNMVVEYAVTLFFELERWLAEPGDT
jgi:hypothetical protein